MVFRSPDHKASSEVETGGYAVASSSTDDVVVVQNEHITSSGLHTIVYAKKYQSPVETTGYIIVYEQGIPHVMFLQRAFMRWIAIFLKVKQLLLSQQGFCRKWAGQWKWAGRCRWREWASQFSWKEISRLEKNQNQRATRKTQRASAWMTRIARLLWSCRWLVVGSHQFFVYGMSQDDQIWKEKSPIQSSDFATEGFNT